MWIKAIRYAQLISEGVNDPSGDLSGQLPTLTLVSADCCGRDPDPPSEFRLGHASLEPQITQHRTRQHPLRVTRPQSGEMRWWPTELIPP